MVKPRIVLDYGATVADDHGYILRRIIDHPSIPISMVANAICLPSGDLLVEVYDPERIKFAPLGSDQLAEIEAARQLGFGTIGNTIRLLIPAAEWKIRQIGEVGETIGTLTANGYLRNSDALVASASDR